jgi:hypothetical protein
MDSGSVAMVWAFLILLAVAVSVAYDARKRGMSPFWWFIGVLALAIVVVPGYFLTRDPLLPQYQPKEQPSPSLHPAPSLCSECGKYYASVYAGGANFCPHCGKRQNLQTRQIL